MSVIVNTTVISNFAAIEQLDVLHRLLKRGQSMVKGERDAAKARLDGFQEELGYA
jgi:predicted nucleic acid-binding protein